LDENLIASYEIPKGMRVVTVSVNLTKTHSGLITPGDRVDVLVTYKARTAEDGLVTRTKAVLEYIQIFATDSLRRGGESSEGGEIKAKNISVLVSPDQANLLMLAESKGQLTLALRSKNDTTSSESVTADERSLDDTKALSGVDEEEAAGKKQVSTPPPPNAVNELQEVFSWIEEKARFPVS
jgi:pilus assembly protein CpaB